MNDSVRRRMIKERVIPKAEEYWFMTDHAQLRAAAAELFLNLLYCEDFFNEIVRVHFLHLDLIIQLLDRYFSWILIILITESTREN